MSPSMSSPTQSIKIAGLSLNDNASMFRLFERCYDQGTISKQNDIQYRNPFPPYNMIREPWALFQKFYDGDHWSLLRTLESWMSRPVSNKVMAGVESYTTLLTDHDPSFSCAPVEPNDFKLAEIMKLALEHWWKNNCMRTTLSLTVKDSRKFGMGWFYLYHDEKTGNSKCKTVHPENIIVSPECTIEDFRPMWLIYEYDAGVGELKESFPKAFNSPKEWDIYFDPSWEANKGRGLKSLMRAQPWMNNVKNPAETCRVYELWIQDNEMVEWDEELDDKVITLAKLKNPGGKRVTVAGGHVIDIRPNPYDHKEVPFTPLPAYPQSGKFWTAGDIQNILASQVMRNRMAQLLHDFTVKAGGAMIFIGKRANLKSKSISNAPVQIHQVADVTQIRVDSFPTPGRHVFNYINVLDNDIDNSLGLHEISQGQNIPGNKSAYEVQVMSESDKTRVRMAARWITFALERMAKQLISNWAQWPDFEYNLKRVSGEETIPGFEDSSEAYTMETFTGNMLAKPGKKKRGKEAVKELIKWDLQVGDSSTLPWSQSERFQLSMQMFQAGIIDDVAVLEFIKWPDYKNIIARKQQTMQQQAQVQAQAQAAMAPPAAPGGVPPEMAALMQQAPPPQMPPQLPPSQPPMADPSMGIDLEAISQQLATQFNLSPQEIAQVLDELLNQQSLGGMNGTLF